MNKSLIYSMYILREFVSTVIDIHYPREIIIQIIMTIYLDNIHNHRTIIDDIYFNSHWFYLRPEDNLNQDVLHKLFVHESRDMRSRFAF